MSDSRTEEIKAIITPHAADVLRNITNSKTWVEDDQRVAYPLTSTTSQLAQREVSIRGKRFLIQVIALPDT